MLCLIVSIRFEGHENQSLCNRVSLLSLMVIDWLGHSRIRFSCLSPMRHVVQLVRHCTTIGNGLISIPIFLHMPYLGIF